MKNRTGIAALVVATLALISSLAGFSPAAGFIITSSKQLARGVVLSSDIHQNGVASSDLRGGSVQTSDIRNGTVTTSDIGNGEVQPSDVTAPEPETITEPAEGTGSNVGAEFAPVDDVGTYGKEDPTSVLEVDWIGTAHAGFSGCVFQIRVDGQPPKEGGGEVFLSASSTTSVTTAALFDGLEVGTHHIEVWARATIDPGTYPCEAGPPGTIQQSFVVSEQVV